MLPIHPPQQSDAERAYAQKMSWRGYLLIFLAVVAAHALAGWGLMQIDSVRQVVTSAAPVFVYWVAPPAPVVEPEPTPPPPEPLPPQPKKVEIPKPKPEPKKIEPAPMPVPQVTAVAATTVSETVAEKSEATPTESQPRVAAAPTVVQAPRVVSASEVRYRVKPNPIYPKRAQRYREQGNVLVRVLINEDGTASNIVLDQSSGSALLDQAAVEAVQRARFYPYLEDGTPLAVWVRIPISFTLKS